MTVAKNIGIYVMSFQRWKDCINSEIMHSLMWMVKILASKTGNPVNVACNKGLKKHMKIWLKQAHNQKSNNQSFENSKNNLVWIFSTTFWWVELPTTLNAYLFILDLKKIHIRLASFKRQTIMLNIKEWQKMQITPTKRIN